MSQTSVLEVEARGPVDWLTLNRPAALNAMTQPMIEALNAYFIRKLRDRNTRVIVMRGAGENFCAGVDVKAFVDNTITGLNDGDWMLRDIVRNMRACPQPIIALLDGAVAGGGMASVSMKMSTAFIRLGLSGAELGLSWHLRHAVGSSVANELMLTGRRLEAPRALALGLVSEVWADAELAFAGQRMADDMVLASAESLRLTKRTIDASRSAGGLETAMEIEERAQLRGLARPEFTAAINAFANRRKA